MDGDTEGNNLKEEDDESEEDDDDDPGGNFWWNLSLKENFGWIIFIYMISKYLKINRITFYC